MRYFIGLLIFSVGCSSSPTSPSSSYYTPSGSTSTDTIIPPPPAPAPVSKNVPQASPRDPGWREVYVDTSAWISTWGGLPVIDTTAFRYGTSSHRIDIAPGECFGTDCFRTYYGTPHHMERKELYTKVFYSEGDEVWWGYSFYVSADKRTQTYWMTQIMPPNWGPWKSEDTENYANGWKSTYRFLHTENSGLCAVLWTQSELACSTENPTLSGTGDFAGKWHDVVIHVKSSKGPNGLVDIWIDDVQKEHYAGATMQDQSTNGIMLKYGIYRQPTQAREGWDGRISIYFDEVRLGKRREDVDIRILIANR